MEDNKIIVNTRVLFSPTTGVQRYLLELLARMPSGKMQLESPNYNSSGIWAHLWEQAILPNRIGKNLLWSPANTGPISARNQVVTIHDMSAIEHPEWFSKNFSAWYGFLLPRLAKSVRKILTVSEFSKDRIINICHVDESKIAVINNAVDERFYKRSADEIKNLRKTLDIPTGNYILALGSLEPRKNLDRLLSAWQMIQNNLPNDLWLILSGAKGKSTVFKDVSLKNLPPRVHPTGHVSDEFLPALYSGAKVFVYPSLYEGFGLPPLEAMACGTAVIVSNTSSLPEVVGDAGLMIDPFDVEEISEAIKRLVMDNDLRQFLCQKGLEQARYFSWDKTAESIWKVLQDATTEGLL